jgi:Skp family chaperone for outer membrane proteins
MHLRSISSLLLLAFLTLTGLAHGEESKPLAVINVSQVVNSVGYETWSQISMDKETMEIIKQLKAQRTELRKRVVESKDDIELQHVNKDIQFNMSKTQQLLNLSRDGNGNGRSRQDSSAVVKDFVISNYKGKYAVIIDNSNQGSGSSNPMLMNDLKTVDITNEVIAAIKAANE